MNIRSITYKLISLLFFFLGLSLMAAGQELKVLSFEIAPTDLTARINGRVGLNGRKCALLKVYVRDEIDHANGSVVGEIVRKGMEKWVYMAHDSKEVELVFDNYLPLRIKFDDFNVPVMTEQMVYIVKLVEDRTSVAPSSHTSVTEQTPVNQQQTPAETSIPTPAPAAGQEQMPQEPEATRPTLETDLGTENVTPVIEDLPQEPEAEEIILDSDPETENDTPMVEDVAQEPEVTEPVLETGIEIEEMTPLREDVAQEPEVIKPTMDSVIRNLLDNMVLVEGGTFWMGSDDKDAWADEKPVHYETVDTFHIGRYEVTQKEWKAVMGSNPSFFKGDNLPVENVSWNDCQEFIRKLNRLTGKDFRLPTEAEWEYAARGGSHTLGYKYSGSNNIGDVAWYDDNSGGKTHTVGTKASNELGLYDMSGNVWEWTDDNWCENYDKRRDSPNYVFRGGSWFGNACYCRPSARDFINRSHRDGDLGLRLVY